MEEQLGLNRELRRASVSIASRIADGAARRNSVEFLHCLHLARGALSELETHIMIAHDQGLLHNTGLSADDPAAVGALLNGLIRSLGQARQAAHAKACYYQLSTNQERDAPRGTLRRS